MDASFGPSAMSPSAPTLLTSSAVWARAAPGGQDAPRATNNAVTVRVAMKAGRIRRSALQQRIDPLGKFLVRSLALDLLAIDEEGRRRIHLQHVGGVFLIGGELVEHRLVREAR